MSYTVLARKWRPQLFTDVVGQGHVARSLMNALSMGRVAHAFLFSGTRGVGKTTTARILAKALNCAKGPTPTPCGECDSCKEVTQGNSVDVIEIDAASNTGVDNVRELRENAKYAPAKAANKIYIIDEVHMLSGAAFNALLKTLEEPPPHVVFILATTDPHKLPATILSRCQHYDFRRVPKAKIEEHLKTLCDREGINVEAGALARVAGLAEGSVRDSLSLLDQVISYCGDAGIREEDINATLGLVGREAVKRAARAIAGQDPAVALEAVGALVDEGQDLRRFASELLGLFRDMLVTRVSPKPGAVLELSKGEVEELAAIAAVLNPEELIRVMNLLSRLADEMKWTTSPRISLELALVKAASRPINTVDEILEGIKGLKDAPAGGMGAGSGSPVLNPARAQSPVSEKTAPPRTVREDADHYAYPEPPDKQISDNPAVEFWARIREEIKKLGKAPLAGKMNSAAPKKLEGGVLSVVEGPIAFSATDLSLIKDTIAALGLDITVKPVKGGGEKQKSLGEVKQEKIQSRHDKIRQEALEDPIVKSALDLFGGEIVEVEDEKTGT
jgi:DNA polymerase-3 subunit gamma/tau